MAKEKKVRSIVGKKNPIQVVWGLLCSLTSTDVETNNISLFNVVEQFNLPKEAFDKQTQENKALVVAITYEIILFAKRMINVNISNEQINYDLKIKTVDPKGIIIQEILSSVIFPQGKQRLRFRIVMQGLSFSTTGSYMHQIEMKSPTATDFEKCLEIPFDIFQK